jgi:LPXTG-site transpeptidase (sortase) family protein
MTPLIATIRDAYRRHSNVAAYAVVLAVMLLVLAGSMTLPHQMVYAPVSPIASSTPEEVQKKYILSTSEPVRLTVPKINLDAEFEAPLSLKADKTVGVPKAYTTVGWYDGSPTPGELGPSIILGHVDSFKGAAVFYNLGKLEVGDTFIVERADGSKPTFKVERMERYPQSDFPTDLVYGPIDHAGIRLITCTGTYNRGTDRYSHNLVVYGRLIDPNAPKESVTAASSTVPQ